MNSLDFRPRLGYRLGVAPGLSRSSPGVVLASRKVNFMKIVAPYQANAISGSIGSATFSRNSSGLYVRGKVMPVNPQTPLQAAVRGNFSNLNASWSLLTASQRSGWENYAQGTPITDRLGQSIKLKGKNWYVGNNAIRLQAGLAVVGDAPELFGLPGFSAPQLTITAGDPISVAFTATDSWATAVGGALLLFTTSPKSAMTNFCKGPYRFAGKISGAATAPTSPQTIAAPFTYAEGQRIFYRAVAVTADGRVSADATGFCVCGA